MVKIFLVFIISLIASPSGCVYKNQMKDPAGNVYQTVKIGDQIWLAENLRFKTDENSFYFNDDSCNVDTNGMIYTWEAAMKVDELIEGWHLPTKDEWIKLLEITGQDSLGYKIITSEKLGFNPQWSGVRLSVGKYVAGGMPLVNYWSSTPCDTSSELSYSVAIMGNLKIISPHNYQKNNACSIRLVKD